MISLRTIARFSFVAALALAVGVAALPGRANAAPKPTCATLSTDSGFGLVGNPVIKYVTSAIVDAGASPPTPAQGTPASGISSVNYCLVQLVYGTNPNQNITIYVGLPLNIADGGSGAVVGNWNGRTEGLGGGVCIGNTSVVGAVNAGYVGSGTDGGHGPSGDNCNPGVEALGVYNLQFIEDFFRNGIKEEIILSKQIASIYYGKQSLYDYWNGCSTGGRQGYLLAQELGDQLDGILASAPAMYWTRFITAEMWGQIVEQQQLGGTIGTNQQIAVANAAIAACDGNDGVLDGIIDDPRTCTYDPAKAVCGQAGAPPAPNCLTSAEAAAVHKIWAGPHNDFGNRIWFPLDRGSDLFLLDGGTTLTGIGVPTPFTLAVTQIGWDLIDPTYETPSSKWENIKVEGPPLGLNYPQVAQDGSRNIADVTDTFGNLDSFRAHGGKMITFVGGNDQLIMPRGVINYYREMAARYGTAYGLNAFQGVQTFYRLFHAPGVGHCGLGILGNDSQGPWPENGADFAALIDWVENGIAPTEVLGQGYQAGTAPPFPPTGPPPPYNLSRPLCPYPQTAVYVGPAPANSTNPHVFEAGSWKCGGNLETPQTVCPNALVAYKFETNGPIDFNQSGINPLECVGFKRSEDGRMGRWYPLHSPCFRPLSCTVRCAQRVLARPRVLEHDPFDRRRLRPDFAHDHKPVGAGEPIRKLPAGTQLG